MKEKGNYFDELRKKGIDITTQQDIASFESYLVDKRSELDNLTEQLYPEIHPTASETDFVVDTLKDFNIKICNPYFLSHQFSDERVPCYALKLRGEDNGDCPYIAEECPYIKETVRLKTKKEAKKHEHWWHKTKS